MRVPKQLWLSFALVPLLTAANQACMKLLAERFDALPFTQAILSPFALAILICELTSFLLWLRVLAVLPVGRAVPISAVAYLLVLLVGWLGFREPFMPIQLLGSFFILAGVGLLAAPSPQRKELSV